MTKKTDSNVYEKIEKIIAEAYSLSPTDDNFDLNFGKKKKDETFIADTNEFERKILLAKHKLILLQNDFQNEKTGGFLKFIAERLRHAINALEEILWTSITIRIGKVDFGGLLLRENAKIMGKFPH